MSLCCHIIIRVYKFACACVKYIVGPYPSYRLSPLFYSVGHYAVLITMRKIKLIVQKNCIYLEMSLTDNILL